MVEDEAGGFEPPAFCRLRDADNEKTTGRGFAAAPV